MQNEFQNRLKALSGQSFPPFCLGEVLTAITEFDEPIQTSLDLDTLVQLACQREDYHFLGGGGDSESLRLLFVLLIRPSASALVFKIYWVTMISALSGQ